jgi:hypothetical protein
LHFAINFDAKWDNKQAVICVGVSCWKLISMIEVECMVEGVTVKKAVILDCFAFLCMPLYTAPFGAVLKFQAPVFEMVSLKEITASSTIWRPS